jgi:hypothetical protein
VKLLFNRGRAGGCCLALGLAVTATACGGGSTVRLPPKTSPFTASASAQSSSPEQAVRSAYTGFWEVSDQALGAAPEQVRPLLRDYSAGGYLDFQVRQILLQQDEYKGPWGKVILHLRSVRVAGSKATVADCQDASHAGLSDTRTHALIPGTRGPQHRKLTAQLLRGGDGRWRVSDLKQFPQSC